MSTYGNPTMTRAEALTTDAGDLTSALEKLGEILGGLSPSAVDDLLDRAIVIPRQHLDRLEARRAYELAAADEIRSRTQGVEV